MSGLPSDHLPSLTYATTSKLATLDQATRRALLAQPRSAAAHRQALARHADLFDRLEVRPPPDANPAPSGPVTVTFWNVERGRHVAALARRLAAQHGAAHLLCELDVGMARSGQRHAAGDLASALGCGYVFGVEFLELGLGNRREQADHVGKINHAGLHGAAILSPCRLARPALVRLGADGAWFDGERGERRVGGRIAILATLRIERQPVTLACVHLESHGDPQQRAGQTRLLLDMIADYAPQQSVLIGGDFNTSTISRNWSRGGGIRPALPRERVMNPVRFEPLFDLLRERGYEWQAANDLQRPTQRWHPGEEKPGALGKIDWFFARGLDLLATATRPALDEDGRTLSDHELLSVTIRPRTGA